MATKIEASHDELMNCVGAFDMHIEKVEKLTAAVPNMVQAVTTELSASSKKLKEVDVKVSQNRENNTELENSVKKQDKEKNKQPASHSRSQLQSGDNGSLLAEAMMKQARFNTAIQLGQSPTIIFGVNCTNTSSSLLCFGTHLIKLLTIRLRCMKYL